MKKLLFFILIVLSTVLNAQILTNYQGKIISKNGKLMAMPEGIVFISNQGISINQVTITLRIDEGKIVNINWGDGNTTSAVGTGINQSYTSNYSIYTGTNSTYIVQLTGDLDYVKRFEISNENTVKFSSTSSLRLLSRLEEFVFSAVSFVSLNLNDLPTSLTYSYIYNAAGTVYGDVSTKTNLTYLYVYGANSITGSITNLTGLTYIYVLGTNTLTGSITNLANLTYIYVTGSNSITGSVTNLTGLTTLNIVGTGDITGSLSNLTNLNTVRLEGANHVTGSLANLTELTWIDIRGNGNVGGSIENLTKLTWVNLGANSLTGPITNLVNLSRFVIGTGSSISGTLDNLTKLTTFILNNINMATANCANMILAVQIEISGSPNLTSFIAPNSSTVFGNCKMYSDNIDKFDFTNTLGITGDLRIYSNPNDTALVLPATLTGAFTNINASGNALNQSSVDNMLHKLNVYFSANTPTAGLSINISGGRNASPTGGSSNPDIVNLGAIFTAAGKTLSILKN